jgi:hypothetical protein
MARNGSGTYNLVSGNPVVTGTTISSTTMNNTLSDIATALTNSLAANGETPVTANIPMNSKKITGLASATTNGDAVAYGQTGASIGGLVLTAQPKFNAQRITSTQSLAAAAKTTVIFNSTNTSVGGGFDTATGIYTAPAAGWYCFSAGLSLQNNNGGGSIPLNGSYFSINNSDSIGASRYPIASGGDGNSLTPAGNPIYACGTVMIQLALNDTVRVKVDNGAATLALTLNIGSYFGGYQLS